MKRALSDPSASWDRSQRSKVGDGSSKVLHVRGLPPYCTEQELTSLCSSYGSVSACLVLPEKGQGFIQMDSIETAQSILSAFDYSRPSIRSKSVFFQFSSHQQIENKRRPASGTQPGAGERCVILINVQNVTVPVTLDNIHQICSPYGGVAKIITFTRGNNFQALVQMATAQAASTCQSMLDGKDLFQGCCHLSVNFSNRTSITVKQNNEKSRDFTMPAPGQGQMGQGQMGQGQMGLMSMPAPQYGQPQQYPPQAQYAPNMSYDMSAAGGGVPGLGALRGVNTRGLSGMPGMGGSPVVLINKLAESPNLMDQLFTLFGVYGDVVRIKILYNKRDTALLQYKTPQQAGLAVTHLSKAVLNNQEILVNASRHPEVKMPRMNPDNPDDHKDGALLTKDFTHHPLHRFKNKPFMNMKNVNAPSQVLHVANIHESVTEEQLASLFGDLQGSPATVEFFKSSRQLAYVCMSSVPSAIHALTQLHNQQLGRWNIRVSFSRKDPSTMCNTMQ